MPASSTPTWSLYPYKPSKPLPIIFAAIIFSIFVLQFYLCFLRARNRWIKFGLGFAWASLVWLAGFICRAYSVWHVQHVGMFIAQYVLVLTGPPLYAVSEYFILGRLMEYLPYHAPMHPGRVLSTFIFLSTAVESLTANGAATLANPDISPARRQAGLACIKAALILQCFIELAFFALVMLMEQRARRAKQFVHPVRVVCYTLYITSAMMFIRCVVRTVEGFQESSCDHRAPDYKGYCGEVATHEWYLWVFEVANITLFALVLTIFTPGRYLPHDRCVYLDPAHAHVERHGPGFAKADKRPVWVTVLDPFDFVGIATGKGHMVRQFWLEDNPVVENGIKDGRERRHASKA